MHFIICLLFLLSMIFFRKSLKSFKEYEATILFVVTCNLFYNFFCAGYPLWKYQPDFLGNDMSVDLIYSLTVLPLTVLYYLYYFPYTKSLADKIMYFLKWASLYWFLEIIMWQYGGIIFKNGWSILWSASFYFLMFPCVYWHKKNKTLCYLVAFVYTIFLLYIFDVPINLNIAERIVLSE